MQSVLRTFASRRSSSLLLLASRRHPITFPSHKLSNTRNFRSDYALRARAGCESEGIGKGNMSQEDTAAATAPGQASEQQHALHPVHSSQQAPAPSEAVNAGAVPANGTPSASSNSRRQAKSDKKSSKKGGDDIVSTMAALEVCLHSITSTCCILKCPLLT